MRRLTSTPRAGYEQIVRSQGLVYDADPKGGPSCWDESVHYAFTLNEVLELERVTTELHARCLDAVEHVIRNRRYADLEIPSCAWPAIERTWEEDSPSLYGRFDLSYDGEKCAPAKLLEYNADTPTALLEAAVIQWHWLEETYPGDDQWNSLHERLVAAWRRHAPRLPGNVIHFAATDEETSGEDLMTVTYLRDTAGEAGLRGVTLAIEEIGWDDVDGRFVGASNEPLHTVFKLYPWEWMFEDRFGRMALQNLDQMRWIEPVWKYVLSGKGILPILWELFPGHPNLLPAYRHAPRDLRAYARKPIWGREGANVTLVTPEEMVERPGPYDRSGWIYQSACPLPSFDGQRPVLGSWIVDGEPAGLGIRESDGPITDNRSRFVPHRIPCASAAF